MLASASASLSRQQCLSCVSALCLPATDYCCCSDTDADIVDSGRLSGSVDADAASDRVMTSEAGALHCAPNGGGTNGRVSICLLRPHTGRHTVD